MEDLRKFFAIVEGGSGVLMSPCNEDETYILTANHLLKGLPAKKDISIEIFDEKAGKYVALPIGKRKKGENYFPHEKSDAAILKIEYREGLGSMMRAALSRNMKGEIYLAGFPANRRGDADPYRANSVSILNNRIDGTWEAEAAGNASYAEISGQSGGGYVEVLKNCFLLLGVQVEMATKNESLGRVAFVGLEVFDEIVKAAAGALSPLEPYYLTSFQTLKESTFLLDNWPIPTEVAFTRAHLQAITESIAEEKISPILIREKFGKRMLSGSAREYELLAKRIWISWLELLIVLKLITDGRKIDDEYLEKIFCTWRLRFCDTDLDWYKILPRILLSDYRGVEPEAIIIVATNTPPTISNLVTGEMILDVARAYGLTKDKFQIDSGSEMTFSDFPLIHISRFEVDGILKLMDDYKVIDDEDALREKLKTEFARLLNVRNN